MYDGSWLNEVFINKINGIKIVINIPSFCKKDRLKSDIIPKIIAPKMPIGSKRRYSIIPNHFHE